MTRSLAILLALAAGCGVPATSAPRPRIADPIPMNESAPPPATEVAVAEAAPEPEPPAPEPPPVHVHEHPAAPVEAPVVKKAAAPRPKPVRFAITVTRAGFEPKNVVVPRGKPVILTFERQIERTCGTEVVMTVDGKKIEKDLPLNKPVELALTFRTAGTVKYSCAMDMIRGSITVQ